MKFSLFILIILFFANCSSRISVRFCCSVKASMTSDMTGQTDLWGENL